MQRLADRSSSRTRIVALVVAALIEIAAVTVLLRGLAVASSGRTPVTDAIVAFRDVSAPPPPPAPHKEPRLVHVAKPARAPAPAGRHALPQAVAAPVSRIVLATLPARSIAATGHSNSAGLSRNGTGQGAGGSGSGDGGGGSASRAVKLSGEIDSARDYPAASRELRLGDYVILALGVDASGAVDDCRIVRASRDAAADAITCRLARERFRFRPARDAAGQVVRSTFGWKQRWFRPGGG